MSRDLSITGAKQTDQSCPLSASVNLFISNQRQVLVHTSDKISHLEKRLILYLHIREIKMHKYLHRKFRLDMMKSTLSTTWHVKENSWQNEMLEYVQNVRSVAKFKDFFLDCSSVVSFGVLMQQTGGS